MRSPSPLKHPSRPRSRGLLAAVVVAALVATSIAVAARGPSSAGTVSGTFYANTLSGTTNTQTCTAANNDSITVTEATYTGTATSSNDPYLNGPITVRVRSIYDSTTNAGSLSGAVSVDNSSTSPSDQFHGTLTAVNSDGTLQGILSGNTSGGDTLLGNLTATFTPSGGFDSSTTQGTIGTGTGTDSAIQTTGACNAQNARGNHWPGASPGHSAIGGSGGYASGGGRRSSGGFGYRGR